MAIVVITVKYTKLTSGNKPNPKKLNSRIVISAASAPMKKKE